MSIFKKRSARLAKLARDGVKIAYRCPHCRFLLANKEAANSHISDLHHSSLLPTLVKLVEVPGNDSGWVNL